MAIWPFGRKSKRHTIQLGDSESAVNSALNSPTNNLQQQQQQQQESHPERHSSIVPESMAPVTADVEPRLTRKTSKRQKNRHSQPVLHPPLSTASFQDVVATRSVSSSQPHPPRTAHSEQNHQQQQQQFSRPPRLVKQKRSRLDANSRPNQQPVAMSRSLSSKGNRNNDPASLTAVANNNGHAVLRKRLSQRKMNKIAREQEIRLMTSSPIDIPRRRGDPVAVGPVKRGPSRATRAERHLSDTSLSNRNDSATSSFSDLGDFNVNYHHGHNKNDDSNNTNRFKVNALAAFTPRPLIRYAEPRMPASRSHNASAASTRRERPLPGTVSEENLSKRRIDHLADGLDAGALRELLDRDRRRQELKNIKDQERAQRKLERSAERQRRAEENQPEEPPVTSDPEPEPEQERELDPETSNRLPGIEESPRGRDNEDNDVPGELTTRPLVGSWLRDASKEPSRSARESIDSGDGAANVVNNIDDSSIREPPKLMQRASFARSQEMGMSRTTLSPTHSQSQSPSRHGMVSPTSSLIYGMARESMSDASHTVDSERRLSDHSGRRTNTFSSLFRRGSSRLKRRYRERFQDTSDLSNASHPSHVSRESFSKIPTQSSAPTASSVQPPPPPRPFNRSTGTMRRAQSKFTEHFGDEPLSPPDSRLQSPDILEEGGPSESTSRGIPIGTAFPIPGSDPDLPARRNRHQRSWITDSVDGAEADNLPLSRSLASIDSEGSWMSGHFLRRISNRRKSNHPARHSTGQFDKGPTEEASPGNEETPFVRFSSNNEEEPPSGEPIEEPDTRPDVPRLADEDPAETWHTEVAKRPVLVNPTVRPKSTEGLLKNVSAMSAMSADVDEIGPIEEHAAEIDYATDEDQSPGPAGPA